MLQFDGAIAGMGTASGTRMVVGMWPLSPYGSVTDVMIERADGHRILLAPTQELADFIAGTYEFDEVRVSPVLRVRDGKKWMVSTDELALTVDVGGRPPLGWVMTAVPRGLARARWWTRLQNPIARMTMDGVRTRGSAGGGRREWYSAMDLHRINRSAPGSTSNGTGEAGVSCGSTCRIPSFRVLVNRTNHTIQ